MKIALVGAELEENLGLRYIAASLEKKDHHVKLVPFNARQDIPEAVKQVTAYDPQVTGSFHGLSRGGPESFVS